MRFRCPVCNGELSYCGPDGPDGPTVDCLLCKRRQERDEARAEAERLRKQLSVAEAALKSQFRMNVDSPLFDGLVGGVFPDGALLASLAHCKGERDEARQLACTLANGGALGGNWRDPYPWLREGGEA